MTQDAENPVNLLDLIERERHHPAGQSAGGVEASGHRRSCSGERARSHILPSKDGGTAYRGRATQDCRQSSNIFLPGLRDSFGKCGRRDLEARACWPTTRSSRRKENKSPSDSATNDSPRVVVAEAEAASVRITVRVDWCGVFRPAKRARRSGGSCQCAFCNRPI